MAGSRTAKIELKTSAAGVDGGIRAAQRKLRGFQREQATAAKKAQRDQEKADREQRRALKRTGDGAAGIGHGLLMGLGAAAGLDIASTLSDAATSVFDVEKELTRLGIDANLSGSQIADFRQQVMDTSNATGVSRLELMKAAHAYQILTGDAKGAIESTQTFADVVNASGASVNDIAAAAASMNKNLGIDPKDFRKGFDVLLNLGHKGALELRDFAGQMASVDPQFSKFGSKGNVDKLTEMGAALETVKLNFSDASTSAAGLRQAMTQISKSKVAERLAAHGVDVWRIDPKTGQHVKRDFFDIIADIKKKVPDQKVLEDILGGRQEATRAIEAMVDHFQEMVNLRDQAANSDQVSVDSHKYMESASGRIGRAWEQIKNSIAAALTPERIEAFASALERAAKFIGDAAGALNWMINGGTKEQKTNIAADDLAQTALNVAGGQGGDVMADKAANDLLEVDPKNLAASYQTIRMRELNAGNRDPRFWSNFSVTDEADLTAKQAGARKYLASKGDPWAAKSGKSISPEGVHLEALVPILAKLAAALSSGIVVKADANAIAKTGKNAPVNRGVHR